MAIFSPASFDSSSKHTAVNGFLESTLKFISLASGPRVPGPRIPLDFTSIHTPPQRETSLLPDTTVHPTNWSSISFLIRIDQIEDISERIGNRATSATPCVHNDVCGLPAEAANPIHHFVEIICLDKQTLVADSVVLLLPLIHL